VTITGRTRLYAIIGDPIEHVRTPMVFNDYAARAGVDAVAIAIQIGAADIEAAWAGLGAMRNLDGFVVTAPHKGAAAGLCDRVEGAGLDAGAVNAVRREPDGSLTGTLLDGEGFVAGLRAQGIEPAGRRVFVAGGGGAGTALAFALAEAGVAALTLHNRTHGKAAALAERVGRAHPEVAVAVGAADASGHDIAVNATALGLSDDDPLAFDLQRVDPGALVAEVIMNPETTRLLREADARGHPIHRGRHMLEGQFGAMTRFFGLPLPE
jgi:shikimate dehydrogenase